MNDFSIIMKFLIDSKSFKKTWQHICEIFDLETNKKKKKFDTKFELLDVEFDNEIMKIKFFSNKLIKTMKAIDEILIVRILTYRQIDSLVDFYFFASKSLFRNVFFSFHFTLFEIKLETSTNHAKSSMQCVWICNNDRRFYFNEMT